MRPRWPMTSVLNVTPNGTEGAIWMSGAGTGRRFDREHLFSRRKMAPSIRRLMPADFPARAIFGNAFLKLSTTGGVSGGSRLF